MTTIASLHASSVATASPTASALPSGPTVYYVSDPSVSGSLMFFFIAFVVTICCLLLHEVLRRRPWMSKVLYPRVEACRRETPEISSVLFGWVAVSCKTPESFLTEKVGLDATMFLRFLKTSFLLFFSLMLSATPVLLPINYYGGVPLNLTNIVLLTDENELSHLGMYKFSISNVADESVYLLIHALFVLIVTLSTLSTMYSSYKGFATLAVEYFREGAQSTKELPPWRLNEAVQLRTVIVQNVPRSLRKDTLLKNWFESLNIGEVEAAVFDRTYAGLRETSRLLVQRERTLKKLERAYMIWARNIQAKKRQNALEYPVGERNGRLNTHGQRIYRKMSSSRPLEEEPRSPHRNKLEASLSIDIIQSLRPKISKRRTSKTRIIETPILTEFIADRDSNVESNSDDAILHYTNKLSLITSLVRKERITAFSPTVVQREQENQKLSPTAFVTFKTQRAAQIASQALMYTSSNPNTMSIRLAPSPQDIIWVSVSMNPIRRRLQEALVCVVATALAFLWFFPANFVAGLTSLKTIAKIPSLASFAASISSNANLYFLLNTVGPPVVVSLFNYVIPYILEFLINKQGLEAHSWIETQTLAHYFFYLIVNVLFVFMLSSTVWTAAVLQSLFANPALIFSLMASTLPTNATFFINYIILNIMLFPIELLRPGIILYTLFSRWSDKTPRERHELNLNTSYLNFGILYPLHLLVFIVILCYSVLAPLILIPGTIYFGVGYLVFKNQMLYVYVKEWESYGRHWIMSFKRVIIGLIIFQVTMAGMFMAKKAPGAACVPIFLIPITISFYWYCQDAFERRTRYIPLDQYVRDTTLPQFSAKSATRLSLEVAGADTEELDNDVVLSAEEYQLERYPTSYSNPVFSKPLPRPWLPVVIADLWPLLPKYSPDGDVVGDADEDIHEFESLKDAQSPSGAEDSGKIAQKIRRGSMARGVLVVGRDLEGEQTKPKAMTRAGSISVWTELETDVAHASDQ